MSEIICFSLGKNGGSVRYANAICEQLGILTVQSEASDFRDPKQPAIKTYRESWSFILTLPLQFFKLGIILFKFRITNKCRVVYFPYFNYLNFIVIIHAKIFRMKIISTFHDYKPHMGDGKHGEYLLNRLCARFSDKVIVLSDSVKKNLKSINANLRVIPHPIFFNSEIFQVRKFETMDSNNSLLKILFFGRVLKYKGISILLSAVEELLKERHNLQLSIIGKGDELNEIVSDNISRLNKWVLEEEIPEIFNKHDILILPYIEATQSGVISIAISAGMPLIASRVGGIEEQVTESSAVLIEPNNVSALADAIRKVYFDRKQMKTLSINISELRKTFSIEKVSSAILEFINENPICS